MQSSLMMRIWINLKHKMQSKIFGHHYSKQGGDCHRERPSAAQKRCWQKQLGQAQQNQDGNLLAQQVSGRPTMRTGRSRPR